jgi:hypothetical protein
VLSPASLYPLDAVYCVIRWLAAFHLARDYVFLSRGLLKQTGVIRGEQSERRPIDLFAVSGSRRQPAPQAHKRHRIPHFVSSLKT